MKLKYAAVTAIALSVNATASQDLTSKDDGWLGATCSQYTTAVQSQDQELASHYYGAAMDLHMHSIYMLQNELMKSEEFKGANNPGMLTGSVMQDAVMGIAVMSSPKKLYETCFNGTTKASDKLTKLLWVAYASASDVAADKNLDWWHVVAMMEVE